VIRDQLLGSFAYSCDLWIPKHFRNVAEHSNTKLAVRLIALNQRLAAPTGTLSHKTWLCLANRCVVIGRRGHRRCPVAVSCIKMAHRLKQEIDMRFPDRFKAGQLLAEKLDHYAYRRDVIVLALPPGGVPVGYEVAKALNAPLDILVIRRLGCPNNPVLAMGAVCADGALVLNHQLLRWLNIDGAKLDDVIRVSSGNGNLRTLRT
jgi:hypothetical protein